jgi:hypothetical protein
MTLSSRARAVLVISVPKPRDTPVLNQTVALPSWAPLKRSCRFHGGKPQGVDFPYLFINWTFSLVKWEASFFQVKLGKSALGGH